MPLYGYHCKACGPFTDMVPVSAFLEPRPCPACGAEGERALSAPAARSVEKGGPAASAKGRRAAHASGCACCAPRSARKASPPAFLAD